MQVHPVFFVVKKAAARNASVFCSAGCGEFHGTYGMYVDPIQKGFITTEHTENTENLKVIALTDKPASENFA